MLAWRIPRIARFVFFYAWVTSWLPARVGWSPAGGSNSLPDGSVHVGRGTVQLHDVTGEVQQARLIVAVQRFANCELPCWTRSVNLKRFNLETKKASLAFGWT